ncbi:hypothetical protein [Thalassococcus sp. S3]|uniref:hypothetical protein n=1 Tax=Thalassococcus sp. S3 TaxID=2017482 RepID=UPI0010248ED1|nr:hypothetical protein [Thalassococcus sp. S3]QBF32201.1 hypothetical protein CFI11_13370 [Thalassococcus sp. S3]
MTSAPNQTTLTLGCKPVVTLTIKEAPGKLEFELTSPDGLADLDGMFFSFADDAPFQELFIFPFLNDTEITGLEIADDGVNTLSNGAQVNGQFDVGLQFGLVDDETGGNVTTTSFSLFADAGFELKIDDLNLDTISVVVNSDTDEGYVLTPQDGGSATPVLVEKTVIDEDFDGLSDPADSAAILSDDQWEVRNGALFTNGSNDGTLTFDTVDTDGPVSLSFDASVADPSRFEATGRYADSLRVEARLDNGDWQLIDNFVVNDDGTALVGSESGQEITTSSSTLDYSGGLLDGATESAQIRFVSDISADSEQISIDNVELTATEEVDGAAPVVSQVTATEDFDDIHDADDSALIDSDAHWEIRNDALFTNGHDDGTLTFAEQATDGPASFSIDAQANNIDRFEADGRYADSLRIEAQIDGGHWQLLDEFVVNDDGTALVGSETGQEIGSDPSNLSYSGGALNGATESVQFRMVSDISAGDEQITFDNAEITTTDISEPAPDGAVKIDFNDLAAGDVVSDQYDGVTISAQRAEDGEGTENDAMIFDTDNPTGGDSDLAYDDYGNALIISEDNDSDDPDDEAHGGTFSFNFDNPANVLSLNVLDTEEAGGMIDLYDAEGELLNSIEIPSTGDNGEVLLDIATDGVSVMDVTLVGSGAIDDLCYVPAKDKDVCDAQYAVGYIEGIPMVDMAEDDDTLPADDDDDVLTDPLAA